MLTGLFLSLCNPNHGVSIEVALVRGAPTEAHQTILFPQHARGDRVHVGVRLHEYDTDSTFLRHPREFHSGATTSMYQDCLYRAH